MAFSVRAGCGRHCGKSLVCYGENTKQSQRPDLKRQQAKGWGGSGEPLQAVCKATRGKVCSSSAYGSLARQVRGGGVCDAIYCYMLPLLRSSWSGWSQE